MKTAVSAPGGRTIVLDDGVLDPYLSLVDHAAPLPRRCYAAGHVVMAADYAGVPHSVGSPGSADEIAASIDWDATLDHRRRLDAQGMGIAEAMDTAQRFELGWTGARALLERTGGLGLANGMIGAASTDHLERIEGLDDLTRGLIEQVEIVRSLGGVPILLPQPWLTENGATEDDYVRVYADVVDASEGEVLLHWLGEVFHPAMRGYFPGHSARRILAHDPEKVRGIKLSLLDRAMEEGLRAEIADRGQVVLTGDDHNFLALLEGSSQEHVDLAPLGGLPLRGGAFSHALLGIFDTVARPAALALRLLEVGDVERYRALMGACERLGRVIFEAPVQRYKAGIAFVAWLNGQQPNPMLANHEERTRDLDHYVRVAELASEAGVLEDAGLAAERLGGLIEARAGA
ncbi:MAG: DUF993 family protein [Planctomycetota bacterium]